MDTLSKSAQLGLENPIKPAGLSLRRVPFISGFLRRPPHSTVRIGHPLLTAPHLSAVEQLYDSISALLFHRLAVAFMSAFPSNHKSRVRWARAVKHLQTHKQQETHETMYLCQSRLVSPLLLEKLLSFSRWNNPRPT